MNSDEIQIMCAPVKSDSGPLGVFAGLEAESTSSELDLSKLGGSREDFISAQMGDSSLIPTRERVTVLNGEPQQPGSDKRSPNLL